MNIINNFNQHREIAAEAIGFVNANFKSCVPFLSMFEVGYLISEEQKNYLKLLPESFDRFGDVILLETLMSDRIVGQTIGSSIYYNSRAFFKIDETDIPRLIGNISHELCHLLGFYHNSRTWYGRNNSNQISYDKCIRSVPYLMGFIMYSKAMGRYDIYSSVFNIASKGGVM
jgi:hypothetical protein